MATVYRATHRNGAQVAIKLLHAELSLDRGLRDRFLREGYVANRVGHEGAVKILDDDVEDDGTAFLVMELLDGETIEQRWDRRGGRLPLSEVLGIAYHAADVLAAAHAQGIVHRDVKPENLFLTRTGKLKILDFGVARLRERSPTQSGATQQGTSVGTPAFMPPEQARGRWDEVDGRSDVWSLGATMFTLLSGSLVHEMDTVAEQIIATATKPAPSLCLAAPGVPAHVVALVDRALAFEKSSRFASMDEMRLALQQAADAEPGAGIAHDSAPPSSGDDDATRVVPALKSQDAAVVTEATPGGAEALPPSLRLPPVEDRLTLDAPNAPVAAEHVTGSMGVRRRESPAERRRRRLRSVLPYMLTGIGIALVGILTAIWLVLRAQADNQAQDRATPDLRR